LPEGYPKEAADFVNKCLERKAHQRLGINGIEEVKGHPWFDGFDWDKLRAKEMKASFIPDVKKQCFDDIHVNKRKWNDTQEIDEQGAKLRRPSKAEMFKDYYFDKAALKTQRKSSTASIMEMREQAKASKDIIQESTLEQPTEAPSK